MAVALSVNLNKIALIRNSREGNYPNVKQFAELCIEQGVQGITVHPRPDQRHIRPTDVTQLSELCRQHPNVEFNVEGNPFEGAMGNYPGFMALIEASLPDQCTLVPDGQSQLTSDHGFDLTQTGEQLKPVIEKLKQLNIRVSLFMDPDIEQIKLAKAIGADRIELYTGPYAAAMLEASENLDELFQRYYDASAFASQIGLGVNAGHDLNLANLPRFCTCPGLLEVSIGHALTVDALRMGMANAVDAYLAACRN